MMIKITEKCSMGCTHCMNNATPNGNEMSMGTLKDVLNFLRDTHTGENLIITGGEPTEHNSFLDVMYFILDYCRYNKSVGSLALTVTTNGLWIQSNPQAFLDLCAYADNSNVILMFQVSADRRYYPSRIETHSRVFRDKHVVLCDNCVEQIYPQGRAIDNNISWKAKASKCFNVRALSKQIANCRLYDLYSELALRMKFCTPHIKIDGGIGLGESDLCPTVATIYDNEETIIEKIQTFKCHKCDFINKNLPPEYQKFL